jgi:hypothetical protein
MRSGLLGISATGAEPPRFTGLTGLITWQSNLTKQTICIFSNYQWIGANA